MPDLAVYIEEIKPRSETALLLGDTNDAVQCSL